MSAQPVVSLVDRWQPCHVDELRSRLDVTAAADLTRALMTFPPRVRVPVAMARCELHDLRELAIAIDLIPPDTSPTAATTEVVALRRWLRREFRMPMGIGFRLARVFGVPADVLCEGYI